MTVEELYEIAITFSSTSFDWNQVHPLAEAPGWENPYAAEFLAHCDVLTFVVG